MFGKKFSKSRRRRLRRAAVGAAAMVLCVFLLFAVFGCAVDHFEIVGNYHETEDEIRGMLGTGPFSNSSIVLWLLNRGRTVRGNTFVDSLTVDMEGLHAVKVNVSEKKLIGCVEYDNRYWYFDRAGVVLVETDPVTKDAGSGSGKQVSGENDTSGNRSVTVETADTEEMAGEQSGTVETVDAEEASGAKKNLSEKIFSKITGTYEMAVVPAAVSDFRIMYLAGDGIIYGDEAVPEDQGDPEAESAEGSEEYPEEASPDANTEEWSEENDFTDETAAEEAEAPYEEYEETGSEENGEADEEADPENAEETIVVPDEIIQPSAVPGSGETENDSAQKTWEIDTSAKGGNYLPLVRGLVFSEAAVGYPLPVQYDRVFSSIAVLKSFVDRSGYVPDDVAYDQEGNLTVTYGGVHVNLGKGDNIESRVAAIGKTLPSIAGLSGILHLENYDGTQNRFIFSKK